MILVLDNYDSFTFNLVQYIMEIGGAVDVRRNDELSVDEALAGDYRGLLVSPGPCDPAQAGISVPLIRAATGKLPVLGVCLGHQAIGEAFGGRIVRAPQVRHGKTSPIEHDGKGVFQGLPQPVEMTRYHSLVIEAASLPDTLVATAWSQDDRQIMGVRHKTAAVEGVQFHPESILSQCGHQLLANFLRQCGEIQ